jgi:hypothetical protein
VEVAWRSCSPATCSSSSEILPGEWAAAARSDERVARWSRRARLEAGLLGRHAEPAGGRIKKAAGPALLRVEAGCCCWRPCLVSMPGTAPPQPWLARAHPRALGTQGLKRQRLLAVKQETILRGWLLAACTG